MILALATLCLALQSSNAAPDDERLHEVWEFLLTDEQEEARQWFTAEARAFDSYTNRVIRSVFAIIDRDAGTFPDAPEARFFDPKEHTPAQVIRRKWIAPDKRAWKKHHKEFTAVAPERLLRRAWHYDYGLRTVVRSADDQSADYIAHNAVAGFGPDIDLAAALAEWLLDDGSQQVALAAFGHTYTDRKGGAYRGLTLYDAWASGREIEMPDVDALGVVHTVLDEWDRWVAPVDGSQHDDLYAAIGEIFVEAHHHRGLRDALARTFLIDEPVYRDAFGPHRNRFHALWFEAGDDPRALANELPPAAGTAEYLTALIRRVEKDATAVGAARERSELLAENRRQVRRLWVHILRELGAFERTRRPKPEPKRAR